MNPETYFDEIDTEEKAYFLGLIAGDGTLSSKVYKGKQYSEVSVSAKTGDCSMVRKFAEVSGYSLRTSSYFDVRYNKEYSITEANCKRRAAITRMFELFGGYKKPDRDVPSIKHLLLPHFFRGLFDADGTFSNYSDGSVELSISTNVKYLTKLVSLIGLKANITADKSTKRLRLRAATEILKFLDFIYYDCNATIYLERKYQATRLFASCKKSGNIGEP